MGGNLAPGGLSQDSTFGSLSNERQDNKPRPDVKLSQLASGVDSSSVIQGAETRLVDLLDCTLWNRRLAPSSERIVHALVQQIFHGIREYFLASAELKVWSLSLLIFAQYNRSYCNLLLHFTSDISFIGFGSGWSILRIMPKVTAFCLVCCFTLLISACFSFSTSRG